MVDKDTATSVGFQLVKGSVGTACGLLGALQPYQEQAEWWAKMLCCFAGFTVSVLTAFSIWQTLQQKTSTPGESPDAADSFDLDELD